MKKYISIILISLLFIPISTYITLEKTNDTHDSGIKDTGYNNMINIYIDRTDGRSLTSPDYNLTVFEYINNRLDSTVPNDTVILFDAGVSSFRILLTSPYNLQYSYQLSLGSFRNASISKASTKNTSGFGLSIVFIAGPLLLLVRKRNSH